MHSEQIDGSREKQMRCIIGIGDSGIDIVLKMTKASTEYVALMADINHGNLDDLIAEHKLYLMEDETNGKMLTIESKKALSEFAHVHKKVYIVTRLENHLNLCGVVEKIVDYLCSIRVDVILVAIRPFLFELPRFGAKLVNETLKILAKYVQKLIVFDSQDLLELKEVGTLSIAEYFKFLDTTIAELIEGGCEIGEEKIVNISLIALFNKKNKLSEEEIVIF